MKMCEALWSAVAKLPLAHGPHESRAESGSFATALQSAFGTAIFIAEVTESTENTLWVKTHDRDLCRRKEKCFFSVISVTSVVNLFFYPQNPVFPVCRYPVWDRIWRLRRVGAGAENRSN
jgi:hypothetical protein